MVIHLPTLLEELTALKNAGIDLVPRLMISSGAHIVFDFHKEIDAVQEERREKGIGTTKKGIGPAYADKATRAGIRVERLGEDLRKELTNRAKELSHVYGITVDIDTEMRHLKEAYDILGKTVTKDMPLVLERFMSDRKKILIEGAQATLLDLDYGTYPFVTSSYTTLAGALQGLGIAPNKLTSCIGIAKAYCTRVGSGHFPAEDSTARGNRLRERGGEYGSVTGRPRRCGWLSIPDLRYSTCINGFTCLNLTKLDVLDEEGVIPVLTDVEKDGRPIFVELKGWKTSTAGIREYKKLPKEAQTYIEFIEKNVHVPVSIIGSGQPREDIIVR
jgi:adenylosuccinate synthase